MLTRCEHLCQGHLYPDLVCCLHDYHIGLAAVPKVLHTLKERTDLLTHAFTTALVFGFCPLDLVAGIGSLSSTLGSLSSIKLDLQLLRLPSCC